MAIPIQLWMLEQGVKLVSSTISAIKSFTLKADTSYGLEVVVVTRLGAVPVKGVKVEIKVGDKKESFGTSSAKGEIEGAGGKPKRLSVTGSALTLEAIYENKTEQVRKEQVTLALSGIDSGQKKGKSQAKHVIAKIRDAPNDADDIDYKREYDATPDLAWLDVEGARVLRVTLKLCTLSLRVPYVNQRGATDTVETRPGLADGKDPETAAHDVKTAKGTEFSGDILCYPSSVAMVLHYWEQKQTRREVMQACYDAWAKSKFAGRKDKDAGAPSATAPASPKEGQYWLDNSPGDAAGFVLKRATFKNGAFDAWTKVEEEDWRLDAGWGSMPWQFGSWATKALGVLKPSGAGFGATLAPELGYTYTDPATKKKKTIEFAPLTKVLDGNADLKKVVDDAKILDKYKEWLGSGWPFVIPTTATDGHMMVARGAVVNEKDEIEWLIVNDPYGNLEGSGASYQADERNAKSGAGSEKGKNAYYRNETAGKDGTLRIKLGGRGFPRIEKAMSVDELAKKIVAGG